MKYNVDETRNIIGARVESGEDLRNVVIELLQNINTEWVDIAKKYYEDRSFSKLTEISSEIENLENVINSISFEYSQRRLREVLGIFDQLTEDIIEKRSSVVIQKIANLNFIKKEAEEFIKNYKMFEWFKSLNKNRAMNNDSIAKIGEKLLYGINGVLMNYPYQNVSDAELIVEVVDDKFKKLPIFNINFNENV